MKAIGVDFWVPTLEEQQEYYESAKKKKLKSIPSIIPQQKLQNDLQKLASKLKQEGYDPTKADENRFRVLVPDDKVNDLKEKISVIASSLSHPQIRQGFRNIEFEAVSEGTPLEERARWDENRWARKEDFAKYHPAIDELLVLVKYWHKELVKYDYYNKMIIMDREDEFFYVGRPIARIKRIAELIGEDAVEKAISEAENEFKDRVDPAAWEIYKNGNDDQQTAYRCNHPENKSESLREIIDKITDDLPLDDNQKKLLENIGLRGDSNYVKDFCDGLERIVNRDLYILCLKLR